MVICDTETNTNKKISFRFGSFVALYQNNFDIMMEAVYYTCNEVIVCMNMIFQIDAIVRSGSKGRFTGVLVHQAVLKSNDPNVFQKVVD